MAAIATQYQYALRGRGTSTLRLLLSSGLAHIPEKWGPVSRLREALAPSFALARSFGGRRQVRQGYAPTRESECWAARWRCALSPVLVPLLAALLSGCWIAADPAPPPVVDVPPAYRAAPGMKPHAALPAPDWWRSFGSRELTGLVERAHLDNLDIAAAVARIEQADAVTRIAGAPLLPLITASGTAQQSGATGVVPTNKFS